MLSFLSSKFNVDLKKYFFYLIMLHCTWELIELLDLN